MSYHGVVLLLTGYQADEKFILKQYRAIVDTIETRYPDGALWILNRVGILITELHFPSHLGLGQDSANGIRY